ncbi:MAG: DUF262 domain-containing protein [Mycoplasma sp.]|nr:DUF262 domain-containing protein [Mycoplasma sp.]
MSLIEKRNIVEILERQREEIYIPIYQRNYDWNEKNAMKLVDDIFGFRDISMKDEDSAYFLGSMVWKKIHDDTTTTTKIVLVDGQQRLTTILLLLRALNELNDEIPIDQYIYSNIHEAYEKQRKLKISRAKSEETLSKILTGKFKDLTEQEKKTNYYKNYHAMYKKIDKEKINPVVFYNVLKNNIAVAWVMLKAYENENVVFETINSTGKPLTPSDLIKNFIFSKVYNFHDQSKEEELEFLYNDKIEDIFEKPEFSPSEFYRYYVAIKSNIQLAKKNSNQIYFDFKNYVQEKNIKIDDFDSLKDLILDIQKAALIYYRMISKTNIKIENNKDSKLQFLKNMLSDQTFLFPMYYSMLDYWTDIENNQIEFRNNSPNEFNILMLIAKYYLYRNIVGKRDKNVTRDVVLFFNNYLNEVEEPSLDGFQNFLSIRESDDQRLPSFQTVYNNFDVSYVGQRTIIKWILLASEIGFSSHEPFTNFSSKFQIEHIMPQEDQKWRDEFLLKNKENKFYKYREAKNSIRNLTLLIDKLNSKVSNSVFKTKKDSIINERLKMNKVFEKYDEYNDDFLSERMEWIKSNFANFFNEAYIKHDEINSEKNILETSMDIDSNFNWIEDQNIRDLSLKIEDNFENNDLFWLNVRRVMEKTFSTDEKGLFETLASLENDNKLSKEIINDLHSLRKQANKAIHEFSATTSKSEKVYFLEKMHGVLTKALNVNKKFNGDLYYETKDTKYVYKEEMPLYKIKRDYKEKVKTKVQIDPEKINWVKKNNVDRSVDFAHEIFRYVPIRKNITPGYRNNNAEIFDKENTKKALFMYLFENINNKKVDSELTDNYKNGGWLTAVTISYFRIDTSGTAKGSLSSLSSDKAKELIDHFVEENY